MNGGLRGDCLSCNRLHTCLLTTVDLVAKGYTCPAYEPVKEEIYQARTDTVALFGERLAIQAMLPAVLPKNGKEDK